MKLTGKLLMIVFSLAAFYGKAQPLPEPHHFTHQDTLRGSITPERAWWDATWYGITVTPDFNTKSIRGIVDINFKVLTAGKLMQIDLQQPLEIESVVWQHYKLAFKRNGN